MTDIHETVAFLNEKIGPTLTALLSGSRSRQLAMEWAQPNGPLPNASETYKLNSGRNLWDMLSEAEGDAVARSWFIGTNPELGELWPVQALREGEVLQVIGAAREFIRG